MKKIALKTMHRASFFMSIINHKCIFKSLNPWGSSINHADGFLDIFKAPTPPPLGPLDPWWTILQNKPHDMK